MLDDVADIDVRAFRSERLFDVNAESRFRLSRPHPRHSLGATVTAVDRPIREAVQLLTSAVTVNDTTFGAVFDCTVYGPNAFREVEGVRLAWFLVNVALSHAFVTRRGSPASFSQALGWFFGEAYLVTSLLTCFSQQQIKAAERKLSGLRASEDLLDLLPYIVEPHGHITRNSFETCDVAKRTRNLKKSAGVYYTPSDVAEFMVDSLASASVTDGTWLDPACGTGVFLRAVLARRRSISSDSEESDLLDFTCSCVFGIDKSALATDLASFVLLVDCTTTKAIGDLPFCIWQRIKQNIVCMDALRLMPSGETVDLHCDSNQVARIEKIFPSIGNVGFDHVLMNPPYAAARVDKILETIWHSFSGVPIGQSADTHLAFTEMLWRLTSERGVSAAVLPLSVGTNTTRSYVRLRDELLKNPGTKEFLFFDREPQALFGEDIKTRNLILLTNANAAQNIVRTSRLLKWTAEQRSSILSRDRLIPVNASQCGALIPKLGSRAEGAIYTSLTSGATLIKAATFLPRIGRFSLEVAIAADDTVPRHSVLVSSTAYNFINCFFSDGLPPDPPYPYSSSPLNALLLGSKEDAFATFALVSSRLCFWLWHVEGDGFHVTGDFLKRLPIWSLLGSKEVKGLLTEHGRLLWMSAKRNAVGSVNGGKQTYSFHCGYDHPSSTKVESILIEQLCLDEAASRSLDKFVQATVSIDGKHRTRRLQSDLEKAT